MTTLSMDIHPQTPRDSVQSPPPSSVAVFLQYLTVEEEDQISQQFQGHRWRHNMQVMWSGVPRECAQRWADERKMQTLTTAMGPLMMTEHSLCLKSKKSPKRWSKYMKGASAVFALHISKGEKITVLSPPPPHRLHPSGLTNYQAIEEPILKGELGGDAVSRIEMAHPTVKGAENFCYQVWPVDETHTWVTKFGMLPLRKQCWRTVKSFTFPQACNASKMAVNHQSLAHGTDVRDIASQGTPKASDKGDQSSPEVVQSDRDNQWRIPEKVEFREVTTNKPKRGTNEGIVASKKKVKREKNMATMAKKQKVTKAKKVR